MEPVTRVPAGSVQERAHDGTASRSARVQPGGDRSRLADAGDCDAMWSICLAIARRRREGLPLSAPACGFPPDASRAIPTPPAAHVAAGRRVDWDADQGWIAQGDWSGAAREMLELYRPLLQVAPGQRYLLGHLGQSIDGRIATSSGDSFFINGQQNLIHIHRLRALCDAVLVGAATVAADDPQLTTRLVPGPHATRVVLDPSSRLTPLHRVCADGRCPTLVARLASEGRCGRAEIVAAVASENGLDLPQFLDSLGSRGLHCILVEGGGITVSRFLAQGLLHRLQIAIAPVIIGSGRQGLQLPEVLALSDCLRPTCRQHQMGPDILWDLDLQATAAAAATASPSACG